MGRDAAELLFPEPGDLPNEDTWLEIGMRSFDFDLVISNRWRIQVGNSVPKNAAVC